MYLRIRYLICKIYTFLFCLYIYIFSSGKETTDYRQATCVNRGKARAFGGIAFSAVVFVPSTAFVAFETKREKSHRGKRRSVSERARLHTCVHTRSRTITHTRPVRLISGAVPEVTE